MTVLSKRIARLEGARGPDLPPVAVVMAALPDEVTDAWGSALLEEHAWRGRELAVIVTPGEPSMLLEPTTYAWMGGAATRIFNDAVGTFPCVTIVSNEGGCMASVTHSERDLVRQIAQMERELAA